jgi:tetratricopeptide (TPR) repeat protein
MVNVQGMLGRQDQTGSFPSVDNLSDSEAASQANQAKSEANCPADGQANAQASLRATAQEAGRVKASDASPTPAEGRLPRTAGESEGGSRYAPEFFGAYAREVRKEAAKASFPQPDKPVQPPQAPPQFLDPDSDMGMGEDGSPLFGSAAKHSGAPISILTNRAQIAKKPRHKWQILQFIRDNLVLSSLALALVLVSVTFFYIQREHGVQSSAPLDLPFLNTGPSLQQLQQAVASQKNDEALVLCNEFVQRNPKSADGFHERAKLLLAMHRYREAADDLTTAESFSPRSVDIHIDRAAAMYYLEDYDKACLEYDNILQIDPEYAFAYFGKGLAENKLNQQESAIKDFQKAIELKADYAAAYNEIGSIHSQQGLLKQAYDDFSRAIQIAEQINSKGDQPDAASAEQRELKSNHAKYYFNRGNCSRHEHKLAQATQDYDKAIALNPADPEYLNNRGLCAFDEKNYARAIADFSSALRIDPNFTGAKHNLKVAQEHLKQ